MSWTFMCALKALLFFAVAIAAPSMRPDLASQPLGWALIATYALTGLIILMLGMLMDSRESAQRPQQIEVLLRHEGKAWLLTVLRNRSGELYAPSDPDMRKMRPVDLADLPGTVLGCPRYIQQSYAPNLFMILGQFYSWSEEEAPATFYDYEAKRA